MLGFGSPVVVLDGNLDGDPDSNPHFLRAYRAPRSPYNKAVSLKLILDFFSNEETQV